MWRHALLNEARRLGALAVALLAAGAYPGDAGAQVGVARAAIVGGAAAADPAVVALLDASGQLACSGVLVASDVVLTAAHCVHQGVMLRVSATGEGEARAVPVAWAVRHPDYDSDTFRADLALLGLRAPLAGVVAAPMRRAPMDVRWLGRPIRVVGYGLEAPKRPDSDGVRRARVTSIDALDAERIRHGPASCNGDSGGAVFSLWEGDAREELIAVVSSGPPACRDYGRATRVDAYLDWIDAVIARRTEPGVGCAAGRASPQRPTLPALIALLAAALQRRIRRHPTLA